MSLKKEKVDELQEAFIMNQGADQRLPLRMMGTVIRCIGCSPSEADIIKLENELSAKGMSSIDFNQLVQIVSSHNWPPETQDSLKEAFLTFDKEGNGYIAAQELRYVLTHMGEKLTDEAVDEMIRECDLTGDGQINCEVLSKSLLNYI